MPSGPPSLSGPHHVDGAEEVVVVAHEVHLAHRRQRLLGRHAVGARGQAQALAPHAHRAAASRGGRGQSSEGRLCTAECRSRHASAPACRGNGAAHGFQQPTDRCSTPAPQHPHLETMMTLWPCSCRSRTVSTRPARLARLSALRSARMRLDVPTLITCSRGRRQAGGCSIGWAAGLLPKPEIAPPRALAAAAAAAVTNPCWGCACRPNSSSGGMQHVHETLQQQLEALGRAHHGRVRIGVEKAAPTLLMVLLERHLDGIE